MGMKFGNKCRFESAEKAGWRRIRGSCLRERRTASQLDKFFRPSATFNLVISHVAGCSATDGAETNRIVQESVPCESLFNFDDEAASFDDCVSITRRHCNKLHWSCISRNRVCSFSIFELRFVKSAYVLSVRTICVTCRYFRFYFPVLCSWFTYLLWKLVFSGSKIHLDGCNFYSRCAFSMCYIVFPRDRTFGRCAGLFEKFIALSTTDISC